MSLSGQIILDIDSKSKDLIEFLNSWDRSYRQIVNEISLFQVDKVREWSEDQKQYFIQTFYHARGHFYDILWYLGNVAPDKESKEMILHNFSEEFNLRGKSHENLYLEFAKAFNVDLSDEFILEKYYLPSIKNFNHNHLKWFKSHKWNANVAAFSAYERLDNIDYEVLTELAIAIGTPRQALGFFMIHKNAKHFDATLDDLVKIWISEPEVVKDAYSFIAKEQSRMWNSLSDIITNFSIENV